jgi:hypothetical protein
MDSVEIIQILTGQISWSSLILTALGLFLTGWYVKRSSKAKAEEIAKSANKEAIEALQDALEAVQQKARALQERVTYLEDLLEKEGIKH